jgi:deoxyribonuclease (pyrimidine dimer)
MTRINCVPVEDLHHKHLVAEYRELPRIFGLVFSAYKRGERAGHKVPPKYLLGTGHVRFFYNKLAWLSGRFDLLVAEMLRRGYSPKFTMSQRETWQDKIPSSFWGEWSPGQDDIILNRGRINERLKTMR